MCKIVAQKVTKSDTETKYTDFIIETKTQSDFLNQLSEHVTETSSVIIQREDVKRLADEINKEVKPATVENSKVVFHDLKVAIRSMFNVQRLRLNPRTLIYMPKSRTFILHYNGYV